MARHADAVAALAHAGLVHAQLIYCFFVHGQLLFASIMAIIKRMGADVRAVGACAAAESICVLDEVGIVFIFDDFFEGVQCFLKRLAIMSISPLQPHRILMGPQHSYHELRRRS